MTTLSARTEYKHIEIRNKFDAEDFNLQLLPSGRLNYGRNNSRQMNEWRRFSSLQYIFYRSKWLLLRNAVMCHIVGVLHFSDGDGFNKTLLSRVDL